MSAIRFFMDEDIYGAIAPALRRAGIDAISTPEAVGALKAAREALGLSLTDMKARTGIEKGNLSRLENAPNPNPTIDTLTRYADAVGKEVVITLVDKGASR